MAMDERVTASAMVVGKILLDGAYKATMYLNDKLTVKATRKRYKGKISVRVIDVVLTIGKPNYEERDFIKKCKKAGEPFPVKRIQVKYPPKKKG